MFSVSRAAFMAVTISLFLPRALLATQPREHFDHASVTYDWLPTIESKNSGPL